MKVGELRESDMGFENKMSNEKQGLDIDGDGETNSSLFFLIIDSGNGYDKLAYSSDYTKKWNMSTIIQVSSAKASRQFGTGSSKLTLLSIDPRASRVMFYDPNATGDWPELGDSKIGDNIRIPVVVKSPDGSQISANVSIPNMKVKDEYGSDIVPTGLGATELAGSGELTINVSALGYTSGRYEFELRASSTTLGDEKINEWMWPRSTVRNFLIDGSAGYGGIVNSFVSVKVNSYGGWDNPVRIMELFTINNTGSVVRGVMDAFQHDLAYPPGCANYEEPADAGAGPNKTYVFDRLNSQYYAFLSSMNDSKTWIKKGDCNFTTSTLYNEGDPINITIGTDTFMLYVLSTNTSAGNASIGLMNLDWAIQPMRMDDWGGRQSPKWSIMSVNRSGTLYNVVFANDSAPYPQAATWGVQEVSKVVWIDTDGNFSDAQRYAIGGNFAGNEYIARVGPGPWEGLIIADSTNLTGLLGAGVRPGMDVRAQDNMPVYFGILNESAIGLDLDMSGATDGIFYMVAYDSFGDGVQKMTRIYVDDDLNISEPWWANSSNIQQGQSYTYYDFYGPEEGAISEQEGSPPKGMWGGNLRFAPWNESLDWEESPEWNIKNYNGTNMILEKNVWNLNETKTISVTVKVFDFAQNPITGATITLKKVMRFGGGLPFKEIDGSDFTQINTQNVTDSNGYGMIKLQPSGTWLLNAEYIAVLEIDIGGVKETTEQWFRIGNKEMGP